jgi:hypothetical protein
VTELEEMAYAVIFSNRGGTHLVDIQAALPGNLPFPDVRWVVESLVHRGLIKLSPWCHSTWKLTHPLSALASAGE